MMQGLRKLVCLVGGAAVCAQAAPNIPENEPASDSPYQAIVERNVFGLRPPPPPANPEDEVVKQPPPTLFLTGISTILGKKLVFLKSAPIPAKPGQPPSTEQYYTLAEGQRDGDLEVLQIDEVAGAVKINFAGDVSTLDFEKNGAKEKPGPVLAAAGQPGQPGIPAPPMGIAPGANPAQGTPSRLSLPNRPVRLPAPGASVNSQAAAGTSRQGGAFGGNVVQSSAVGMNAPSARSRVGLSAEEQAILIEAERERTRAAVSAGTMPPLPPTPFTQAVQPEQTPTQTAPRQRPRPIVRPGMPLLPQ